MLHTAVRDIAEEFGSKEFQARILDESKNMEPHIGTENHKKCMIRRTLPYVRNPACL